MKVDDKTLGKLTKRIPKFMSPDLSRVETLDDLRFQIQHEIDLAEEDEIHYTKPQMHRAKMFFADVHLAAEEFARVRLMTAAPRLLEALRATSDEFVTGGVA